MGRDVFRDREAAVAVFSACNLGVSEDPKMRRATHRIF
jgi:hypothetical protein